MLNIFGPQLLTYLVYGLVLVATVKLVWWLFRGIKGVFLLLSIASIITKYFISGGPT